MFHSFVMTVWTWDGWSDNQYWLLFVTLLSVLHVDVWSQTPHIPAAVEKWSIRSIALTWIYICAGKEKQEVSLLFFFPLCHLQTRSHNIYNQEMKVWNPFNTHEDKRIGLCAEIDGWTVTMTWEEDKERQRDVVVLQPAVNLSINSPFTACWNLWDGEGGELDQLMKRNKETSERKA